MRVDVELNLLNLSDCILGLIIEQVKQDTARQLRRIMVFQDDDINYENSLNNLAQTCWKLRGVVQANKLTYVQAHLALLPKMLFIISEKLPYTKLALRGFMLLLLTYLLWIIPIKLINNYFMKKIHQRNLVDCIYLVMLLIPMIVFGCYIQALNKSFKINNIVNNQHGFFQRIIHKSEPVKQLKRMHHIFSPLTIESGMRSPLLRDNGTQSHN